MPFSPNNTHVQTHHLTDDGVFPNNPNLPLLVYPQAVAITGLKPAVAFETRFGSNRWGDSWRNGIYDYHHYHSTAHEVLGVFSGSARVACGGDGGVVLEVHAGDVVVIPAGVAHKNLGSSGDFGVVGAYPEGQDWDMNTGKPGERPKADRAIATVPLPHADPVFGAAGPLVSLWKVHP